MFTQQRKEIFEIPDLRNLRQKQISKLREYRFHRYLKKSEQELEAMIPQPCINREAAAKGYNKFIVVIPPSVIDISIQVKLAGIYPHKLNFHEFNDFWETPLEPYWIQFMNNADECKKKNPLHTMYREFEEWERGLTAVEGIHILIQYPDIVYNQIIELTGTQYQYGFHVPHIYFWNNRIEMAETCSAAYCHYQIMGGFALRVLKNT